MKHLATLSVIIVLLMPLLARAQVNAGDSCLAKMMSKFHRDQLISVTRQDGLIISGQFVSFDRMQALLALRENDGAVRIHEVHAPAVTEYRVRGRLRAKLVIGGLLVGAVSGAAIGTAVVEGDDSGLGMLAGMAIGAPGGLLLGTIVSALLPTMKSDSCE